MMALKYEWDDAKANSLVIEAIDEEGRVVDEVFQQWDDATRFRREINRAGQKEDSKRCNPHGHKIRDDVMSAYFIGRLP
jgi:hypothetical protein